MGKSKRLTAIAFSDLHIDDWKQFNKDHIRLHQGLEVLRYLDNKATKYGVPLLFAGDLFHNDSNLSNIVIQESLPVIASIKSQFIGIDGNHDQSEMNQPDSESPGYFASLSQVFAGMHCVNFKTWISKNLVVHGIPYINQNVGFKECVQVLRKSIVKGKQNILLIHTDLPNALDTDGRMVNTAINLPTNLPELFKGFDLVLSGHIHKPQAMAKNILMLGAPIQQRRTDKDCAMGYWKIYSDNTYKFIHLKKWPVFKDIEKPEDDDGFNFCTPIPKPKHKEQSSPVNFKNNKGIKKLANEYLKDIGETDLGKKKKLIKYLKDA